MLLATRFAAALPAWLGGLALLSTAALAGEIAGAPPLTLPSIQPRAELLLSNDAFGRGGDVDDFRTQQLMFSAAVAPRWQLTLDHSVLTLEEQSALPQGRLDQFSGSLGFNVLDRRGRSQWTKLSLGGGFRAHGQLAGERIQNGVHRLFTSSIVDVPYVRTQRTDLIAWVRGERLGMLKTLSLPQWLGGAFETGYWLHGTMLASTDGQWDGVAGAVLTAHRGGFETWLGLRGDWRSGYDRDPVQRFTADNETGGYVTFGLRVGPLLIETNQGFDDDAAFGRISLVSGHGPGLAQGPWGTGHRPRAHRIDPRGARGLPAARRPVRLAELRSNFPLVCSRRLPVRRAAGRQHSQPVRGDPADQRRPGGPVPARALARVDQCLWIRRRW